MKLIQKIILMMLFAQNTSLPMEPTPQEPSNQNPDNLISGLEISEKNDDHEKLKAELSKNKKQFDSFIKDIKKAVIIPANNKSARKIVEILGKVSSSKDSYLGVKGITKDDVTFLYPFFHKKHKEARKKFLSEMGNDKDLKHISTIMQKIKSLSAKEIEEQRISLIHEQVALYLDRPNASKEDLRKEITQEKIEINLYLKATSMSLYAAFLIEPHLPKKNDKK